jgi:hypothetical protein
MSSKEKVSGITAVHPRAFPRLGTSGIGLAITLTLAALILPISLIGAYAQDTEITTVTIDSVQLNEDRTATVTYTVECSEDATVFGSGVTVVQSTGRFGQKVVSGSGGSSEDVPCDENGVQLTQTVVPETGFFTPGRATITASAVACVDFSEGPCDEDSDRQVLTLRR